MPIFLHDPKSPHGWSEEPDPKVDVAAAKREGLILLLVVSAVIAALGVIGARYFFGGAA
jgi:hypothetical protein